MLDNAVLIDLFVTLGFYLAGAFVFLSVGIAFLIITTRRRVQEKGEARWSWRWGYMENMPKKERTLYVFSFVFLVAAWGIVGISAMTLWIMAKLLST